LHERSFLEVDLVEIATDPRANIDRLDRGRATGEIQVVDHVSLERMANRDRRWRRRNRTGRSPPTTRQCRAAGERQPETAAECRIAPHRNLPNHAGLAARTLHAKCNLWRSQLAGNPDWGNLDERPVRA